MKPKKNEPEQPLNNKLWAAADKLRKNMDAAEYKHVALGLIFLKYISDAFEELHQKLVEGKGEYEGADPEDKNEYTAENVFYVPPSARWKWLQGRAKLPTIGKDVDDAMLAIEKDNPSLRGVLPIVYAQEKLDKQSLGGLIDLFSTATIGTKEAQSRDVLGEVYEYFLGQFALAEGKKGGQFYTPTHVVRLLVEMLEPYEGRVFDPCCGSGGMFVQSEKFVKAHQDYYRKKRNGLSLKPEDRIAIYGQESNQTTWKLCKMNLAIRHIDSTNVKWNNEGSFLNDAHKDLKADFILANPPFNDSDWSGELLRDDARWKPWGESLVPPVNNANYAWILHFLYHLAPNGRAGFVLADGSLTSDNDAEYSIRKKLIEKDVIECIVSLPDKLFFSTPISVSIWIMSRDKRRSGFSRAGQVLLIDATHLGKLVTRTHRELTESDIDRIANTYRSWSTARSDYQDIAGFCISVSNEVLIKNNYSLLPAAYISHKAELQGHDVPLVEFAKEITKKAQVLLQNSVALSNEIDEELSRVIALLNDSIELEEHVLADVLEPSDERLGDRPEPEILTCTERGGLILQRERFAKRIATENTSNYKVVYKGDIVFNPYLLWAGAIDQCWIVDMGITSPAYEVLRVKKDFDPVLVGYALRNSNTIKRYAGISVGTVKRRKRASVERFLAMKLKLPKIEHQNILKQLSRRIKELEDHLRLTTRSSNKLLSRIYQEFLGM